MVTFVVIENQTCKARSSSFEVWAAFWLSQSESPYLRVLFQGSKRPPNGPALRAALHYSLLEVQIRSSVVLARHGGLFDAHSCSSADSYSATGRTAKQWSGTGGYRECNAPKSFIQSQQPLSKQTGPICWLSWWWDVSPFDLIEFRYLLHSINFKQPKTLPEYTQ